jgi:hypothetical protein
MAETTITHKYNIGDIVLYTFVDHLAEPRVTIQETGQIVAVGKSKTDPVLYWVQINNGLLPKKIWEDNIIELRE